MRRRVRNIQDEPIHLVPYDPAWPRRFEEERAQLEPALRPWLAGPVELVKRHTKWESPDWVPQGFDPDSPDSIRPLAPILGATRVLGMAVRAEGAAMYPETYKANNAPYYGFVFSHEEGGMLAEEPDTPLGGETKFLLINPARPAFRTARSPEALCDTLTRLLVHEHGHEYEPRHSERFTTVVDQIHDRVANSRGIGTEPTSLVSDGVPNQWLTRQGTIA